MKLRPHLLVACWLAIGCGPAVGGPATPPAPTGSAAVVGTADPPLPLDARITTGTLANGLRYYVLPHHKPLARAELWLAVNAGSVLEDEDQRGLAHLVEHMAFNGTKRFPKQSLVDYIERSGMRFGADLNAYTSFDQTVYQLTVPTDDPSAVETGLDILRDWAGDLSFDADEVEKERGVVLEEWRLGRGAGMRLFDKKAPVLLHDSRYATRITIGLPEVIEHAPYDAVVRFYQDWYRPDLMAVIAVGDLGDPAAIVRGIERRFAELPAPAQARPRTEFPIPHDHELLVGVATDPEMPTTQIEVYDKLEHRPERSLGDYRRSIVERLFHQMLNERFREIARRPDAPFVSAASYSDELGRTADAFVRQARAESGRAREALDALLGEIARVERHGFAAGELGRAKDSLMRSFEKSAHEADKTASRSFADELTRHFFTGEAMPGREAELDIAAKLVPTITLDEENALARGAHERGRVVLVTGPDKEPLPDEAQVLAAIGRVERSDVAPWVDTPPPALMAALPARGTVTATRSIAELGVTEWTLSNGAKVVVKPTDFQNDEVGLTGFSPGGTSLVPDADFASARFAAEVVGEGGLGALGPSALDKALSGKLVRARAWIGELEEGISAGASPADLETMFQLVHLRFTAPRKDADVFTAWQAKSRDAARNRRLRPEAAFGEDMAVLVSDQHPRRAPVTPEVVAEVDLDRALAIYRERFADAGDFTFVIVGNVELGTLQPLVETYLASLPTIRRKETWKDVGVRFPKGHRELTVSAGSEPKSFVFYERRAPEKWSKDAARDLAVLQMLLSMRLREVLREDLSGVYGVRVSASLERRPREERDLSLFFGCAPGSVTKLRDAALAVVAAVQKDGLGEDYLTKVREQLTRTHESAVRENGFWLSALADAWRFGDDPKDIPDLAPVLARVTAANVKQAAQKYLDARDSALGVLRPAP
ncbi:MAG: insulinase family protein [Polyangiaceae bacterium]|nr:insulinase family protein [Polyangiaceae bacterium]